MTGYYDVVLGLIPLALAGISGALLWAGLELTMAVSLASVVGLVLVGHAMFVNGPVSSDTGTSENAGTTQDSHVSAD